MALAGRFYVQGDGDIAALDGQHIAIIGYGNLGRPAALNLRDAGLAVVVGAREGATADQARAEGFPVAPVGEALSESDVVWFAVPDEVASDMLSPSTGAHPRAGALVCVSSGYCLANGLTKLPDDVDAVMLAPRMVATQIRRLIEAGESFFSFVSVEQDATGTARARLLALAEAFGTLRRGAIELPAATEATLDLFIEQTVGPYLGAAVLSAFEVGSSCGLPPEALALELYLSGEMARTWQTFAEEGFFGATRHHGHSATFGGFTRMGEIDTTAMKEQFARTYEDIASGAFADRFQQELAAGFPCRALIEAMIAGDDPMSAAEASLRRALPAPAPAASAAPAPAASAPAVSAPTASAPTASARTVSARS